MDLTIAFDIPINRVYEFLLVFCRIAGIIFFSPIFDNQAFFSRLKLGLILALSIVIFPVIELGEYNFEHPISYALSISKELMIGIVIGFAAKLIFIGIHLAGNIAGRQMGLGMARVLSPQAGTQIPIIAQFYGFLASMIFLSINGHHWLLVALHRSFDLIPLSGFRYSFKITAYIVTLFSNIFATAIKLSAPIIATLFLTNLALGLIVRAVPEINVFILGFPLKISLGLFIVWASIRVFTNEAVKLLHQISNDLMALINFMA